jgi:tRNA-2-methylthio-N6-dimethylallyladenosine synthase
MNQKPRPKRAYVETYGCQMNISDGELMQGILADHGYEIVGAPEDADVVLVNTCAIREHAERRVLGRVSQLNGLKRERPEMVIGVTGCMAQRLGKTLLEQAPYVDLVMGPDGYRGLPEALERLERERSGGGSEHGTPRAPGVAPGGTISVIERSRGRGPQLAVLDLNMDENYQGLERRRADGPSAWVPIQRGCDHRCTYCIVPYVRGGEKNRSAVEVLSEVRRLAEQGVTEVTLLGQTVNSYVWEGVSFPGLLRDVARIDGIRRVRFTSPHPNDVTPDLVEVMAEEDAVCEQLLEKVELVRSAIPDVALSTDIIVAFPGETDDEFRDTLDLMRTVRFDEAFTYKYSLREGTPATRLPESDFVDADVAQARLAELIEVSRNIQSEINQGEIGRVEEVLIEHTGRDEGQVRGRTRRNKVVVFDGDPTRIGEYADARLDRTTGVTFIGTEVGAAESVAAG